MKCTDCFFRAFKHSEGGTTYSNFCYYYLCSKEKKTCNYYEKVNCSNCEHGKYKELCSLTKKPLFKTKICNQYVRYQGWGFDMRERGDND